MKSCGVAAPVCEHPRVSAAHGPTEEDVAGGEVTFRYLSSEATALIPPDAHGEPSAGALDDETQWGRRAPTSSDRKGRDSRRFESLPFVESLSTEATASAERLWQEFVMRKRSGVDEYHCALAGSDPGNSAGEGRGEGEQEPELGYRTIEIEDEDERFVVETLINDAEIDAGDTTEGSLSDESPRGVTDGDPLRFLQAVVGSDSHIPRIGTVAGSASGPASGECTPAAAKDEPFRFTPPGADSRGSPSSPMSSLAAFSVSKESLGSPDNEENGGERRLGAGAEWVSVLISASSSRRSSSIEVDDENEVSVTIECGAESTRRTRSDDATIVNDGNIEYTFESEGGVPGGISRDRESGSTWADSDVDRPVKNPSPSLSPEYIHIPLTVIHRRGRTGFEEEKDIAPKINEVIAERYQVIAFIGSAAFSVAVEAFDMRLNQLVCMKIIKVRYNSHNRRHAHP